MISIYYPIQNKIEFGKAKANVTYALPELIQTTVHFMIPVCNDKGGIIGKILFGEERLSDVMRMVKNIFMTS